MRPRLPRFVPEGSPRAFRIRRLPPYIGRPVYVWECTLCHPPATGQRCGDDGWLRIIMTSGPRHFRVRMYHHAYVLRTRGKII